MVDYTAFQALSSVAQKIRDAAIGNTGAAEPWWDWLFAGSDVRVT